MKYLFKLLVLAAVISPIAVEASIELKCRLKPIENGWSGPCGRLNGHRLAFHIRESDSIKSGYWRSDMKPASLWAGTMKFGEKAQRPVEIERYQAGPEFARTAFGWFEITNWSHNEKEITFSMHPDRHVRPSDLDFSIIERAKNILSSVEVWNKEDNRKCPKGAKSWSIYCAMIRASVEVAGGSHHRRPALQVLRKIVQKRSDGRNYKHRLMDYNNDRSTQFTDVYSLFNEAQEEIKLSNN
jgi:hypothetical protein